MATPKVQKCFYCDGYVGNYFTEGNKEPPFGYHERLEDCIMELLDRIKKLESRETNHE